MNLKIYQKLKKNYDSNDFDKLLQYPESLLFLKIRSIARKSLLIEFANIISIDATKKNSSHLIQEIIKHPKTAKIIDEFIKSQFEIERKERQKYQNELISELYKLQIFDWGGLYQNNLERTIIDSYVKKIKEFKLLLKKIDEEINVSVKGYVLCSWFNHWTSILIEDIFKSHRRILPAIGLIKKVDFFIDKVPFDLKVTYFPEGFMQKKRKEKGLKPELTELKQIARKNNIIFNSSQNSKLLSYELLARLSESHIDNVKESISNFHKMRWQIIEDTMKNKMELARWLYEEQGERRFDSANRLFLVLIDKENLEESWKLKRNIDFLKENIEFYLKKLEINDNLRVLFHWKGEEYKSISDILFIVKT